MSITAAQRAEYDRLRRDGYSAKRAMESVKHTASAIDLDWQDGSGDVLKRAKLKQDGFTCFINVRWDDFADTSYLGEFSDNPGPGAIKHDGERGSYEYFNPANVEEFDRFDKYQRMLGLGRHDLRLHIERDGTPQRDYELMLNLESYWIEVKAQLAGVVLGRASLGGIDVDSRDYHGSKRYLSETALELVAEAVEEAKAAIPAAIEDLNGKAALLASKAGN